MTNEESSAGGDHRAEEMCRMRADGYSLQTIADTFGLTRERVRQIVLEAGGPTAAQAKEGRRARLEREQRELRDRAREILLANPGTSAEGVARQLGVTVPQLRKALGPDAAWLLVTSHKSSPKYTDEQVLEHLRLASTLVDRRLTVRAYKEVREQFGGVSGPLVLQRFGSWQVACRLAGVEHGQRVRQDYPQRWGPEQMIESVAEYLQSEGSRGSFAHYEQWARGQEDRPSGQTIRSHFGRWSVAKAEAIEWLRNNGEGFAG